MLTSKGLAFLFVITLLTARRSNFRQLIFLPVAALLLLSAGVSAQQPSKVELQKNADGWKLLFNGEPYYVKGVGGSVHLDRAVAYGANSVRTWGVAEAEAILDAAHAKGLTVLFGLWVGQERQGFDYTDGRSVAAQLARFTEVVKAHKDHPALLMWGIGNENDLFYSDFRVWNAINDIAKMIHEVDPNHPTMTVTAGLDVAEVQLIQERAPHIDNLGINTYGGLIGIDRQIRAYGWDKPYMITEWGPTGHWEVPKTSWGVPLEQSSTEKAEAYARRFELGIAADREMCIGSYVFLWGQKQETTPTWYGLFLEDGSETDVMDVLQKAWSGQWPANRSPSISSYTLNGKAPAASVILARRSMAELAVDASDPEAVPLRFRLEILPESTDIRSGGDAESRPTAIETDFIPAEDANGIWKFRAPKTAGPYRLFIYAYDDGDNAAVANIPFFVK